jgi:hypothetical protein
MVVKGDQTPPMSHQVAHFLDWAARNYPYDYFGYNVILKAIRKLASMPKVDSKETELVKSVMCRSKKILLETYRRGFDSARGVGCRACVNSEDTVKHDLKGKAKKRVAIDKAIEAVGTQAVTSGDFSDTAEGKQLASFHRNLMKSIDYKSLEDRLGAVNVKQLEPGR